MLRSALSISGVLLFFALLRSIARRFERVERKQPLHLRSSRTRIRPVRYLHDAGLTKAADNQFEILRILVGQHFAAVFQGVVGIDP
jgi:hypothetical protein